MNVRGSSSSFFFMAREFNHGGFQMLEKADRNCAMYATLNWQQIIGQAAGPMKSTDTRESWLARAARRSRVSYRQIKSLYYGDIADPKLSIALGVLTAADRARKEANELATRFETLAGAMNATDQNFYSADVLALIRAARSLRGLDSA
jgi:hypothetical protein